MDERREFPRYHVSDLKSLSAKIALDQFKAGQKAVRIETMSLGGVGFVAGLAEVSMLSSRNICFFIEWPEVLSKPLQVPAKIVFARPIDGSDSEILYGAEWQLDSRILVQRITDALKLLQSQGKVKLSLLG